MKKLIVLSFVAASSGVYAQGYVGAVAALTSIGGGCASGQTGCDKKGFGLRFFAGSKLAPSSQLDLGVGKLDAVEVGISTFGKGISHGTTQVPVPDDVPMTVATSTVATANATTFAAVSHFPIIDQLSVVAKVGVAYVSSTLRYYVDTASDGSETTTKVQPYLGVGFEYAPIAGVKLVGSYDWTRFNVASQKGSLGGFGVGAQFDF